MKGHALFQWQLITIHLSYIASISNVLLFQNHFANFISLGTKQLLVKWIQCCSNKGQHPLPMGESMTKCIFWNLLLQRPISTKLGRKHLWLRGCWSRLHYKFIVVSSFFNCQFIKSLYSLWWHIFTICPNTMFSSNTYSRKEYRKCYNGEKWFTFIYFIFPKSEI